MNFIKKKRILKRIRREPIIYNSLPNPERNRIFCPDEFLANFKQRRHLYSTNRRDFIGQPQWNPHPKEIRDPINESEWNIKPKTHKEINKELWDSKVSAFGKLTEENVKKIIQLPFFKKILKEVKLKEFEEDLKNKPKDSNLYIPEMRDLGEFAYFCDLNVGKCKECGRVLNLIVNSVTTETIEIHTFCNVHGNLTKIEFSTKVKLHNDLNLDFEKLSKNTNVIIDWGTEEKDKTIKKLNNKIEELRILLRLIKIDYYKETGKPHLPINYRGDEIIPFDFTLEDYRNMYQHINRSNRMSFHSDLMKKIVKTIEYLMKK